MLIGDTPDASTFKFHIWEDACYLDPNSKQPKHDILARKFLGIAWNHIDSLCYLIVKSPTDKSKRPQTLVRSVVRKSSEINNVPSSNPDSDKIRLHVEKGLSPINSAS